MYSAYNQLDGLANMFGFTYQGNSRYKTSCGASLTLLLGLLTSTIVIVFLLEFLDRSNPKIEVVYQKQIDPPSMEIHSPFAFHLKEEGKLTSLDDFVLTATNRTVHNSELYGGEMEDVPLVPCTKEMFASAEDKFEQYKLDQAVCLNTTSFTIKGGFPSKDFNFLNITLSIKEGITRERELELQERIDSNDIRLHIFFLDHSFAYDRLNNPINTYMNHYDVRLIYENYYEVDLLFQPGHFSSYDSYISFSSDSKDFYEAGLEKIDYRTYYRPNELNRSLCQLQILASITSYDIKRSFMTFASVLANIVGMVNASNLIVRFFYFFYSKTKFYLDLLNNFNLVFRLDKETENKSVSVVESKEKLRIKFAKNTNVSSKVTLKGPSTIFKKTFSFSGKFKKIKFEGTFWNIFSISFLKNWTCLGRKFREKAQYYEQGLLFFEKHIGFESFLENMRQFSLLKKFVLTDVEREIIEKTSSVLFLEEFKSNHTIKKKHQERKNGSFRSDLQYLINYCNRFGTNGQMSLFEENFKQYLSKFLN